MPSYPHPGVYIEEIPSGFKPIEGISSSTTAFVGSTFRGPANTPTLIGTWDDYVAQFSNYHQSSGISSDADHTALAVRAFYQNGGKAAYICRVLESEKPTGASEESEESEKPTAASVTLQSNSEDALTITASSEGKWGDQLNVVVTHNGGTDFNLYIGNATSDEPPLFVPLTSESFEGLSMQPSDDNFVEKVVNGASLLVRVSVQNDVTSLPDKDIIDEENDRFENPRALTRNDGVDDEPDKVEAIPTPNAYLSFYENILRKFPDVSIIVLPGVNWDPEETTNQDIINHTINHCESTMNREVIIDPPANTELTSISDVNALELPTSTYSVLYYPWVEVSNPLYHPDSNPTVSQTLIIPPSSIAAGMWAKIDGKRGVWKAPAGVETRISVSGLQYKVEDLEQDSLNPLGVNCLRNRPGYGPVFWGSRTLATKTNPEWRYVPVRRTAIFIEQSIYNGIQWAVFESNDEPLWSSLRANIGSFMNGMFRSGAFQGASASQAYFVRCAKGDTMTQADIDRGQVIIVVGFAPLKPAEFVILRLQQKVEQQ